MFENQFNYRLKDEKGSILREGMATAYATKAGEYGKFSITIPSLPIPQTESGILELFDVSAKDGTEIDKVSIPIAYDLHAVAQVRLYFQQSSQSDMHCTTVIPTERNILQTMVPARAAVDLLLAGPSAEERSKGYVTSIPNNVTLQKLTIENGVAKVDFSNALQQGVGGSCRVTAIREQIRQTLLQFPAVKDVIISIDGRTEDILQP